MIFVSISFAFQGAAGEIRGRMRRVGNLSGHREDVVMEYDRYPLFILHAWEVEMEDKKQSIPSILMFCRFLVVLGQYQNIQCHGVLLG